MDKAELIERLKGYEWNDVEFKEVRRDVPRSAYETVSAFANTEGGHLVFGGQAGSDPSGLVTDQARSGRENLSTAQADRTTGSLLTAQADPLTKLSANQRKIIEICDMPHSLAAIMRTLGVAGRGYFKRRHLDPLLRGGVLRMIHPNQPKHPDQAYVLTEAGTRLTAADGNKDAAKIDGNRTNGA